MWLHLHASFAKSQGWRQEPIGKGSALAPCHMIISLKASRGYAADAGHRQCRAHGSGSSLSLVWNSSQIIHTFCASPAIATTVKAMQRDTGTPLFIRAGRGERQDRTRERDRLGPSCDVVQPLPRSPKPTSPQGGRPADSSRQPGARSSSGVGRAGRRTGSKGELMASRPAQYLVEERNLKVQVAALRHALRDSRDGSRYISTVAGRGY